MPNQRHPGPIAAQLRRIAALSGALLLAACKTFSPNGGMDAVASVAGQELNKDVVAIRSRDDALAARTAVERLLKRPLTVDAAVQIAVVQSCESDHP